MCTHIFVLTLKKKKGKKESSLCSVKTSSLFRGRLIKTVGVENVDQERVRGAAAVGE